MNCKPGDLAFIVRSDFPENLGRVVRVVALVCADDPLWHVAMDGSKALGYIDGNPFFVGLSAEGFIGDDALRPIRPEPELLPAPPVAVTA